MSKSKIELSKVSELIDTQEEQLHEAFRLFDPDETGTIETKNLVWLLRSLGLNPTTEDIEDVLDERDPELPPNCMDINEVREIIIRLINDNDFLEELIDKIREYDTENTGLVLGKIVKKQLKETFDYLCEEEVSEIFRELEVDEDSEVDYQYFIYRISSTSENRISDSY